MLARVYLAAVLLATNACGDDSSANDYSTVLRFDTTRVHVMTSHDSVPVVVEIARSPEQRTLGLMERRSLPESAGMLFLYPSEQPASAGFWMFRTRIPLDIAYLDSTGTVVATRRMEPCLAELAAGCPSYEPGVPYHAALEVNAGFFERHGIVPGTRVDLSKASTEPVK
jgi:hypothetical protein